VVKACSIWHRRKGWERWDHSAWRREGLWRVLCTNTRRVAGGWSR